MSVFYRKTQNKNKKSATFGQWYGRSVILSAISTKDLAVEIAHSTTVTEADVMAVLTELAVSIKNHLLNSQKVVIDNLGSFRVGLKTTGVADEKDFNASRIKGYRIVYTPETTFTGTGVSEKGFRTGFRTANLLRGITAEELPDKEKKATENTSTEG